MRWALAVPGCLVLVVCAFVVGGAGLRGVGVGFVLVEEGGATEEEEEGTGTGLRACGEGTRTAATGLRARTRCSGSGDMKSAKRVCRSLVVVGWVVLSGFRRLVVERTVEIWTESSLSCALCTILGFLSGPGTFRSLALALPLPLLLSLSREGDMEPVTGSRPRCLPSSSDRPPTSLRPPPP